MYGSTRIAIIGGGASAVCLLDVLSRQPSVPDAVTVFDPSRYPWRGRAYQPDSTAVRVNAPPDDMSVRSGDVHHFERWLQARELIVGLGNPYIDPRSGVRFVPRAMYGDYLEQSARAALTRLSARGCQIDLVREVVTNASQNGRWIDLETHLGDRYCVDYAVLCVGGGSPQDIFHLSGSPRFVADPYPVRLQLAGIPVDEDVAVIGSGLTGVDVVLSLAAQGHRGRISLLSRRSVLPAVRQQPVNYELRHFTPARFRELAARQQTLSLGDAAALMRAELASAGVSLDDLAHEIAAIASEDPADRLRRQLAAVDEPALGLRILQRAVPDSGPDVWPLLPENDKAYVLRNHYRTVMSLCCPMPPASAAALLSLVDSGQLELLPGLEDVTAQDGNGFRTLVAGKSRAFGTVVNAVSAPVHRIPPRAEPLIGSLVRAGLAARHPRGGLHVDRPTSRLVVDDGRADPRLYALGDLAAGSLFFTFGVPSLVDRALDIARAVFQDASARTTPRGEPCRPFELAGATRL
jgi:uncharacterized NAD(P)/FAD-binding protein YdhS